MTIALLKSVLEHKNGILHKPGVGGGLRSLYGCNTNITYNLDMYILLLVTDKTYK